MPKGMHMVMGLSSLNTRKRKLKITKQRMLELVEQHRLHNKEMKQSNKLDMMMTFDEYLDWSFGKKKIPKTTVQHVIKICQIAHVNFAQTVMQKVVIIVMMVKL